ncbi:flagellar motor switch protein FliG [Tuberibacillus sp. Marseille-P3662]|uniref:flagellar motor switch protein FliG n=1 Tax=Tuberibacillus sp. Marseille-P3662 TaxID=1965358 RepID=UPI000A1CB82D|nr:flagellar motor switch protein FliG [Tuberibacillus sp. Marseille-P3662]
MRADMNSKQKAAILMIALGSDVAASVYQYLSDEEVEQLTLEMANVRKIDKDAKQEVMNQFYQLALGQEYITQGGIGYAKEVLEKALGSESASEVINRLTSTLQVKPFDFMRKMDANQILNFIQHEHPQTIALVLSYLNSEQSGQILSALPQDVQGDIARRIAVMDRTSPEIVNEVERILEQKLSSTMTQDYTQAGGLGAVVEVLNGVDRSTEKTILESLSVQDPELAEDIKKRMFVFEDLVALDDRAIQRVIRDVDNEDLMLALKSASDDVKGVIYKNMSERMAATLKEETEFMGPVRLRDVEEAQTRIVSIIRRLEETGEIVIARGGSDDIVV